MCFFVVIAIKIVIYGASYGIVTRKLEGMCDSDVFYENSLCHSIEPSNDLPSGDKRNFPSNSIYFIETTCKGGLDFREACSVESAARIHPNKQVNILFAGPVAIQCLTSRPLAALLAYKNIRMFRVHPSEYIKNTPLEFWLKKPLKKSYFPIKYTLDMLKLLTLFKFGGVYLDLNMMLVKNLDLLPYPKDWVVRKWPDILGTEAIALSDTKLGRTIINTTLVILRDNFNPIDWSFNAIGILKKALKSLCGKHRLPQINPTNCHGLGIYAPHVFYPIRGSIRSLHHYMKPEFEGFITKLNSHGFLLWNQMTAHERSHESYMFSKVLGKYCPHVQSHVNTSYTEKFLDRRNMNCTLDHSCRSSCFCH